VQWALFADLDSASACGLWPVSPARTGPTDCRPSELAAGLRSVGHSGRTHPTALHAHLTAAPARHRRRGQSPNPGPCVTHRRLPLRQSLGRQAVQRRDRPWLRVPTRRAHRGPSLGAHHLALLVRSRALRPDQAPHPTNPARPATPGGLTTGDLPPSSQITPTRRRCQRGAPAAQRGRTTLTPTSDGAHSRAGDGPKG